jgi:hypothetical protein
MSRFSRRSAITKPRLGRKACPHLGIKDDPQTCLAYPSEWNLCQHVSRPSAVNLEHQRVTCLTSNHTACPVFQGKRRLALPRELRVQRSLLKSKSTPFWLLMFLLVLGFSLWGFFGGEVRLGLPFLEPPANLAAASESTTVAHALPLVVATGETESVPAILMGNGSPASSAQSPGAPPLEGQHCGYELENRIDLGQYALVLHRVGYGENLDLLASKYETSLQAIQAINYFLPSPLWVNQVIVIPFDQTEISGLPYFEPYFVLDPVDSLKGIAREVSVTESDLREYNHLDAECPVFAGWLLLPHADQKTP